MMKDELDRMVLVSKKVVYGLLVEGKDNKKTIWMYPACRLISYKRQGFTCRIFAMDNDYTSL